MLVTIGQIRMVWPDAEIPNLYQFSVFAGDQLGHVGDSIIWTDDAELIRNYLGSFVYVYNIEDVPNNLNLWVNDRRRRTGQIMTWNDGSIRRAQNNHSIVGQRISIDEIR